MPSNASISEENIIDTPKANKNHSDRCYPSLPFSVILGGFSPEKKAHTVRIIIGIGPARERKFALNLQ
jgi:hypothetical protein